jgi:hypothetical protein
MISTVMAPASQSVLNEFIGYVLVEPVLVEYVLDGRPRHPRARPLDRRLCSFSVLSKTALHQASHAQTRQRLWFFGPGSDRLAWRRCTLRGNKGASRHLLPKGSRRASARPHRRRVSDSISVMRAADLRIAEPMIVSAERAAVQPVTRWHEADTKCDSLHVIAPNSRTTVDQFVALTATSGTSWCRPEDSAELNAPRHIRTKRRSPWAQGGILST